MARSMRRRSSCPILEPKDILRGGGGRSLGQQSASEAKAFWWSPRQERTQSEGSDPTASSSRGPPSRSWSPSRGAQPAPTPRPSPAGSCGGARRRRVVKEGKRGAEPLPIRSMPLEPFDALPTPRQLPALDDLRDEGKIPPEAIPSSNGTPRLIRRPGSFGHNRQRGGRLPSMAGTAATNWLTV